MGSTQQRALCPMAEQTERKLSGLFGIDGAVSTPGVRSNDSTFNTAADAMEGSSYAVCSQDLRRQARRSRSRALRYILPGDRLHREHRKRHRWKEGYWLVEELPLWPSATGRWVFAKRLGILEALLPPRQRR